MPRTACFSDPNGYYSWSTRRPYYNSREIPLFNNMKEVTYGNRAGHAAGGVGVG